MTLTVSVRVREDSPMFHGCLADVNVEGNGSPEQFLGAIQAAMYQARREQIASRLKLASDPLVKARLRPTACPSG